ncbi:predicted protein [Uncinocarpus reesii 1704]|uniref:CFEM domain-containing protein n=1 Tax=Uncinocarpus reesii (strain UAMH 1704) TaxID=336963 RepID=C4JNI8_UNCRE|nr:uncharacterized protein UREG_02986 [Uncinocarpus reesii 1704]EEP78141.1 predicted protein [Uncinocarpus reesii 1704]
MKAAAFFSLGLCAVFGAAQNLDDIPQCGRMCIQNMLNKAAELGCAANDIACLCSNRDFGNGIHDCTQQACRDDNLDQIIAAGRALCPNNESDTTSGAPATTQTIVTSSGTGSATLTETISDTVVTSSSPYSTAPVVSTVTDGSQTMETTVGSTTLFTEVTGSGSVTETPSPTTVTSEFTSTLTSGSNTETVTGTTTETQTNNPTTTSEGAAGRVMATAGPGVAGALGLMALFVM